MSGDVAFFTEDDLLPLSALQHLVFCERQAALIHIEQQWHDNRLTLEGSHMHGRVDETAARRERRGDLLICRGVPLRSLMLGLSGRADVVEFHRHAVTLPTGEEHGLPAAVPMAGLNGLWKPFPVDYKRGKPKSDRCDEVQLCAQALCLQEMLSVLVPEGALFYGREQRRVAVLFDDDLRGVTEDATRRLHDLVTRGTTPPARRMPKCKYCSLLELCMPESKNRLRSARAYLRRVVDRAQSEEATDE